MVRLLVGLCSAALLFTTNAEAKGPFGSLHVGQWRGGAYTNDATGEFSHCAGGTSYVSGISVVVFMYDTNSWALGFAHERWQLQVGEAFPITLTFDGQAPTHVFGE